MCIQYEGRKCAVEESEGETIYQFDCRCDAGMVGSKMSNA
jgi:hypothetical protein